MTKKDIIDKAKENNGYVFYKELRRLGFNPTTMARLENDGTFRKIDRGIHLLEGYEADPFFILSRKYSNLVFSHSTALYLNGLSNRSLQGFEATFPHSSRIPSAMDLKCYTTRTKNYILGKGVVLTPYGNNVPCYDAERCICDIFAFDDIEYESKAFAINEYMKRIDFDKLYSYAKELRIYDRVREVFEVLAWR